MDSPQISRERRSDEYRRHECPEQVVRRDDEGTWLGVGKQTGVGILWHISNRKSANTLHQGVKDGSRHGFSRPPSTPGRSRVELEDRSRHGHDKPLLFLSVFPPCCCLLAWFAASSSRHRVWYVPGEDSELDVLIIITRQVSLRGGNRSPAPPVLPMLETWFSMTTNTGYFSSHYT